MAKMPDDETIEYVGILAKLELSAEEKEQARKDMGNMLAYIDKMTELDTADVEPMSHIFPVKNVFREDVVRETDVCQIDTGQMSSDNTQEQIPLSASAQTLVNAPAQRDDMFVVPSTFVQ